MEEIQYQQNILLITKDTEIKDKIASCFKPGTNLKVVPSSDDAIEYLTDHPVEVVIIDAKVTNQKVHYSEDKEMISFFEISQYANHLNPHLPIVILTNAILSKDGTFAAKCGATLIMDRKDISRNRLIYVLRVLRKRTYRTILTRDMEVGQSYPVDVYHFLPVNKKYLVFMRAGEEFTEERKNKIQSSGIRHLYVREDELSPFLKVLKQGKQVCLSEELATIQYKFRKLLIDIFNVSTDGAIHFGKKLVEDGMAIVDRIDHLILQYPDPYSCLKELPYPRWSAIAHGINSAIYALIFARACQLDAPKEIAFASLIHNIGLSEIDQEVVKKKETELTPAEIEEYKKHVQKSLEIIHRKKMIITPLMEKTIAEHHENYDGTGYPNGLSGDAITLAPALLSILGSFDHLHTIRPGERTRTIHEVWEKVKRHHKEATKFNQKFHPALMDKIEAFFKCADQQQG